MADLLRKNNKQYEYIVYPDASHSFDALERATYSATAAADAQQKAPDFFKVKLQ